LSRVTGVDKAIAQYLDRHRSPDDTLIAELVAETRAACGNHAGMQITAAQGTFLRILAAAIGARRAIEVGTFTGLSALSVARALPPDGRLIACDVSAEWTSIAKRYWERAGVAERIELRLAPALETLESLPLDEPFDFAFVDADKESYPAYYEALLARLRPGGLLAIDNALWSGRVLDPADASASTRVLRELNEQISRDPRVDAMLLAVADGTWVVRRL